MVASLALTLTRSVESILLGYDLPDGIVEADVKSFFERHQSVITKLIETELQSASNAQAPSGTSGQSPPTTVAKRTRANLAALQALLRVETGQQNNGDSERLRAYTGWGGLSIDKIRGQFTGGMPVPDSSALIHEYYTPTQVTDAVASIVARVLPGLPRHGDHVDMLEPSAGIGRFVDSILKGVPAKDIHVHAVEVSDGSARILQALHPSIDLYKQTFESFVVNNPELHGTLGLVVANPPYGPRGASKTEDPDRSYRDSRAYAYFLRRALDMLAKDGMGVFVIPAGFMSGTGKKAKKLREQVLRRHHLMASYRLPSGLFPGAQLVTDLLFFRARGGELAEVAQEDRQILDGLYYELYPDNILGVEVGKVSTDSDVTALPRWGYQVRGTFTKLPAWQPRALCVGCGILTPFRPASGAKLKKASNVVRKLGTADTSGLPHAVQRAVALGARVDRYLAAVGAGKGSVAAALHADLVEALQSWVSVHGVPKRHADLVGKRHDIPEVGRFLTAFDSNGSLISGIAKTPEGGSPLAHAQGNITKLAEWLRSTRADVTRSALVQAWASASQVSLMTAHRALGDKTDDLERNGWRPVNPDLWMHPDDFATGELWPRLDVIDGALLGDEPRWTDEATLQSMHDELMAAIEPMPLEDIGVIEPRAQWLPTDMLSAWIASEFGANVTLTRVGGMLQPVDVDYVTDTRKGTIGTVTGSAAWFIGYCNHDFTLFSPPRPGQHEKKTLDDVRLEYGKEWTMSWESWVRADRTRVHRIERLYNRTMRGFVTPKYADGPLGLARWAVGPKAIALHPHQNAGTRRVVANNGGLLGYDVGVGKTFTACAILARMRELGRKRPVILVPNSIIWKWAADIAKVLPDYEVLVVGSERRQVKSGARKGQWTSRTDTPDERAEKWTRFQSGEADVVLCTYSVFGRTSLNVEWVEQYVDGNPAVKRMIEIERRNAEGKKKRTERQEAIVKEGARAWVAERLELPAGHLPDPGIAWDDLGIDLLIVDEAQNFKNLYLPESREGGVPRFMGNAGKGSQRAWQLDFRAASVRERSAGGGVVLLSATPAKNSPLEFYSMIQYIDGEAWERLGIYDSEAFISRFLEIELEQTLNSRMAMVKRSAVVGFMGLDELRSVIFRYGEILTGEDVGLVLPEATVEFIELDMSAEQEDRYADLVTEMEDALNDREKAGQVLGILARMSLVCIHARLDGGYKWKTALASGVDPHSPKFDAIAERIARVPRCGHIVFLDNTAGHAWLKQTLIAYGIAADRIAVLSAETAKAPADRLRIANEFNGSDEQAPLYDVVICNQVAYEGIDLQRRTCSIHHADLPWEPATLQQRNGRGVRQGNTLSTIAIYYYFAARSLDGLRFNLISGKLGWMKQLIKSTDRATTNPGATLNLGKKDILMMISRDPEATRKQLEAMEQAAIAENMRKVAEAAGRRLRTAAARFRGAERQAVDEDAAQEREEAESVLAELEDVDPAAWPYFEAAKRVRHTDIVVTPAGVPLYEGLLLRPRDENVPPVLIGRVEARQVGRLVGGAHGWTRWQKMDLSAFDELLSSRDVEYAATMTVDEHQTIVGAMKDIAGGGWDSPYLTYSMAGAACDAWLTTFWANHASAVIEAVGKARFSYVPGVRNGVLRAATIPSYGAAGIDFDQVLPPTKAGWARFSELFNTLSAEQRRAGRLLARHWWGRSPPTNRRDATVEAS